MAEPATDDTAARPVREKPYQRKPPPPKEFNRRMAWEGSATAYDETGKPLHTWWHVADAAADPEGTARRVAADVARALQVHPTIDVACIQNSAPELDVLPQAVRKALPTTTITELTDIHHTVGNLEKVVDACEPEDDSKKRRVWFWSRLLHDDDAIDRIVMKIQRQARNVDEEAAEEQEAIEAALTYIGKRTDKMRYATGHAANLNCAFRPIRTPISGCPDTRPRNTDPASASASTPCPDTRIRPAAGCPGWSESLSGLRRNGCPACAGASNLTIGSGDTENTCWQMQDRVTRPAQPWAPDGSLRGILSVRGLVLSGTWPTVWQGFVDDHRKIVTPVRMTS